MRYWLASLVVLSASAAAQDPYKIEIDNEWGINNTYLFFEWMVSNLDDFKGSRNTSAMHIGTNTWMAGLAFEM